MSKRKEKQYGREAIIERFMAKVEKQSDGCWYWTGAQTAVGGYGAFWYLNSQMSAHRASHELFKGPVPAHLVVMHSCDVPSCVNPDHLSLGTYQENSHDMLAKGRHVAGTAKLDIEEVAAIKGEYVPRYGELERLAQKYNVNRATIWAIVNGHNWAYVKPDTSVERFDGPLETNKPKGAAHHRAKLTEADVREIRRLYDAGEMTLEAIGERFGLKKAQTYQIAIRKAWKHVE